MRCLRCAIDYPPGSRYCDRCGRSLSRPLGAARAASLNQPGQESMDTDSLYSTFFPPAGEHRFALPETWITLATAQVASASAVSLVRDPVGSTVLTAESRGARPKAPRSVYLARSLAAESAGPTAQAGNAILTANSRRARPAQMAATTDQAHARHRRLRAVLLGAPLTALLTATAGIGYQRHTLYDQDLRTARVMLDSGRPSAAAAEFRLAIGAWPWHAEAQKGLTAAIQQEAGQTAPPARQNRDTVRGTPRMPSAAGVRTTAAPPGH
jgi:hypothetical protein